MNVSSEYLENFFSDIGEIINSRIITYPETGKSRGFGFVEFLEKKAQYEALKLDGQILMGKNLSI